jgi:threonine dehydrogenase-like Zn-dependent dehydrogenase
MIPGLDDEMPQLILVCGHYVPNDSPRIPGSAYCEVCTGVSTVDRIAGEFIARCDDCRWCRKYGLDYFTAHRRGRAHAGGRGHTVTVGMSQYNPADFRATIEQDEPPF